MQEAHHHCCDVIHDALLLSQPTLMGLIDELRGKSKYSGDGSTRTSFQLHPSWNSSGTM